MRRPPDQCESRLSSREENFLTPPSRHPHSSSAAAHQGTGVSFKHTYLNLQSNWFLIKDSLPSYESLLLLSLSKWIYPQTWEQAVSIRVCMCFAFKIIHVYSIKEKRSKMLMNVWSGDKFLSLKIKENRWKVELQHIFKLLYI